MVHLVLSNNINQKLSQQASPISSVLHRPWITLECPSWAPSAGVVDKKLPELATGAHPTANWIAPLGQKNWCGTHFSSFLHDITGLCIQRGDQTVNSKVGGLHLTCSTALTMTTDSTPLLVRKASGNWHRGGEGAKTKDQLTPLTAASDTITTASVSDWSDSQWQLSPGSNSRILTLSHISL